MNIYDKLIEKEKILHTNLYRKKEDMLNSFLHDDFMEFCRSGCCVNKTQTIQSLSDDNSQIEIFSEDYHGSQLDKGVVLLTYISYQLENNQRVKQAYRSSIWIKNPKGDWQLRFHQGTAK